MWSSSMFYAARLSSRIVHHVPGRIETNENRDNLALIRLSDETWN
jgi:hypothetical protein